MSPVRWGRPAVPTAQVVCCFSGLGEGQVTTSGRSVRLNTSAFKRFLQDSTQASVLRSVGGDQRAGTSDSSSASMAAAASGLWSKSASSQSLDAVSQDRMPSAKRSTSRLSASA